MKELTIEQKAQRYDEAIERARQLQIDGCSNYDKETIWNIFPELVESEDEKIRKGLIDGFTVMKESKNCGKTFSNHNIPVADILAWLEKQGEKKPAFEMKTPEESLGIDPDIYNKIVDECVYGEQKPAWSEEDEKCIDELIKFFDSMKDCLAVEERHQENRRWLKFLKSLKGTNVMQLLQEWSIEDNIRLQEAIRIVQNYHNNIKDEYLFATSGWCLDWLKSLKNRVQQQPKQKWSEEDELHIRELESLVKQEWAIVERENDKAKIHKMRDLSFFLKTLKPQLKQEWSGEDELSLKQAIYVCHQNGYTAVENWLKSLKPQKQWKPSEEQIRALHDLNLTGGISYAGQGQVLIELYKDLKNNFEL